MTDPAEVFGASREGNVTRFGDPAIERAVADHEPKPDNAVKPPAPFDKPGLFVTYKGWDWVELVTEAKAWGFHWLALQNENRDAADKAAFCLACRNGLVVPGVWESAVDYGSPARVSQGFDFYIGQIEGPGQLDRVLGSDIPVAPSCVVSNYGGLDEAAVQRLDELGYQHCIAECWVKTDPHTTPEAQVAQGKRLGFLTVSPMAGLGENGASMADYPTVSLYPGYSVFAAEELLQ